MRDADAKRMEENEWGGRRKDRQMERQDKMMKKRFMAFFVTVVMGLALSGCTSAFDRLQNVGSEPELSSPEDPTHRDDYKPVSMPMPKPLLASKEANSLWRPGSRAFFKDLRAHQVGDIVTVLINVDDAAQINNETSRSRENAETAGAPRLLGFESELDKILPSAVSPGSLLNISGKNESSGKGQIKRQEKLNIKVAAVVTQVLPNGNLVIHGRQETRVNFEVRELQIAGVIRPQDIEPTNTIAYEKIAEARVAYGGRGHITDVQQPRYGNQIVDIFFPF